MNERGSIAFFPNEESAMEKEFKTMLTKEEAAELKGIPVGDRHKELVMMRNELRGKDRSFNKPKVNQKQKRKNKRIAKKSRARNRQ